MTGTHLQTQAYLCHLASSFPGEEFPLGLELFVHRTSDTGLSSDSAEWEGYPCPYTGGEECSTLPHPEPQVDRGGGVRSIRGRDSVGFTRASLFHVMVLLAGEPVRHSLMGIAIFRIHVGFRPSGLFLRLWT